MLCSYLILDSLCLWIGHLLPFHVNCKPISHHNYRTSCHNVTPHSRPLMCHFVISVRKHYTLLLWLRKHNHNLGTLWDRRYSCQIVNNWISQWNRRSLIELPNEIVGVQWLVDALLVTCNARNVSDSIIYSVLRDELCTIISFIKITAMFAKRKKKDNVPFRGAKQYNTSQNNAIQYNIP